VKWPCFYGIDFATRAELIASGLDTEGVRASIGADSLGYLSLDGLVAATEQPRTRLCRACFDGNYPIELPQLVGKHVLEGIERAVGATESGTLREPVAELREHVTELREHVTELREHVTELRAPVIDPR
jgi:amidophosphoribosyltransferase